MNKYFTNFHQASLCGYSATDRKILQIRDEINSRLYLEDFAAVDGIIRGVLYSDRALCSQMILWRSKWEQNANTLLHDILNKPKDGRDPPISLLQIVLDIAPSVLTIGNVSGWLPLHNAVYIFGMDKGTKRSLEIIKFLVEADTEKVTLSGDILQQSVWRGDEDVARYLLSFKEGRTALLSGGFRNPLYYVSRDYFAKEDEISNGFLYLFLEATAEELKRRTCSGTNDDTDIIRPPRCCCIYDAMIECSDYLDNEKDLKEVVKRDHLYCSRHANEVNGRNDQRTNRKRRKKN